MYEEARKRLILALDVASKQEALDLVRELHDVVGYFKIGMQLYYSCGNELIAEIKKYKGNIFLDLKLHDIPNTVYNAAKVLAELNVDMINFHAAGGREMLTKAVQGLSDGTTASPPLALAVTVLTSLDNQALANDLGFTLTVAETVKKWAQLAQACGCQGVVCSPQEIAIVKQACGKQFLTITPGIRPQWSVSNDQKRITTPYDAMVQGGDYVVIGRPIRSADSPRAAALKILEEMSLGLSKRLQ